MRHKKESLMHMAGNGGRTGHASSDSRGLKWPVQAKCLAYVHHGAGLPEHFFRSARCFLGL